MSVILIKITFTKTISQRERAVTGLFLFFLFLHGPFFTCLLIVRIFIQSIILLGR